MKPESIKCRAKRLDRDETVEGWYYSKVGEHWIVTECSATDFCVCEIDPATLQLCSEAELKIKPSYFKAFWNSADTLPKITTMTSKRKRQLETRCKEPVFMDNWKTIIRKMADSPFLTGKETNWHADVTWLLANDNNYIKVFEGKYDRAQAKGVEQRETSLDRLARLSGQL
jgi:hypothetical protein